MNILQHLTSRKYEFTFHEFFQGKYGPKYCSVCCGVISGPAYITEEDVVNLHKSCAESPAVIKRHPFHPDHPLTIQALFSRVSDSVCDGCRHVSSSLKFRCRNCKFNLDWHCIEQEGRQPLKGKVEKPTDHHPHMLQLLYFPAFKARDALLCCCCLKGISDSAYVCFPCKLFIHESCLDTIPEKITSSFHPGHPLLPRKIPAKESSDCQACREQIEGIELRCQSCKYSYHVSCGKHTTRGLTLRDQEHKLFYLDSWDHGGFCGVCGNLCERGSPICRCIESGQNFHVRCILPPKLSHEVHDDHPIFLTNSVVLQNNLNEYNCDFCEQKGDIKRHVYHCKECNYYNYHIECVLSEEDPLLKMVKDDSETEQEKNDSEKEGEAENDKEINEPDGSGNEGQVSDEYEEIDDESEENDDGYEKDSDEED